MIRHLPYFIAAAEEQNFQRAADRMNIAQSALSRRIRDLELELGAVPLFVRFARGVRLTPSGEALLEDAQRIMADVQAARDRAMAILHGDAGTLRIGYSTGAVRHRFIGDLLRAIRDGLPNVHLNARLLGVAEQIEMLRRGELDAAICYTETTDQDLASLEIACEEYVLAMPVGHPLLELPVLAFDDIRDEDFIWYAQGFTRTMHRQMVDAFESRGAEPRIVIESPAADTTLRLVAAGLGLGFVPRIPGECDYPGTVQRGVRDFSMSASFRLFWLRSNRSSMVSRLVDAVSAAVTDSLPPGVAAR